MNDKDFKNILLTILKSMDTTLRNIESSSIRGVEIDLNEEGSESILIPEHIYAEICEIIGSDHIDFMGIS